MDIENICKNKDGASVDKFVKEVIEEDGKPYLVMEDGTKILIAEADLPTQEMLDTIAENQLS